MPQVSFRCPDPLMPNLVSVDECLEHSRTSWARGCSWTHPILKMMVNVERDYMSPTGLQKCPREWFFQHATNYSVDPEKAWPRVRGTAFHANVESSEEGLSEVRLQRTIDIDGTAYVMRGQVDLIQNVNQPFIRDWKTTDIAMSLRLGTLPKADHIEQVSVYAWMLAANELGDSLTVSHGEIVYVDMKKQLRKQFALWDHVSVEGMIRARMPLRSRMLNLGMAAYAQGQGELVPPEMLTELPDVLPVEDRWRCDYCDVRGACDELAQSRGEERPYKPGKEPK